jgi:hypothetical protein
LGQPGTTEEELQFTGRATAWQQNVYDETLSACSASAGVERSGKVRR